MSFNSLMVHQITTKRRQATVGIQKSYQTNLTNYSCMIQPLSPEYAAKNYNVFGRAYHLYVPLGADIQIGDRATDQDGKVYQISGSLNRNYGNSGQHLTFWMTEEVGQTPDQ